MSYLPGEGRKTKRGDRVDVIKPYGKWFPETARLEYDHAEQLVSIIAHQDCRHLGIGSQFAKHRLEAQFIRPRISELYQSDFLFRVNRIPIEEPSEVDGKYLIKHLRTNAINMPDSFNANISIIYLWIKDGVRGLDINGFKQ